MLSILIPVYNFDITSLVRAIIKQGKELNKPFEIIISDDGSDESYLQQFTAWSAYDNVKVLLNENSGRATNRNRLAREAIYNHLLFIDSDVSLPDFFLKKYVEAINGDEKVVVGGILLADPNANNGAYYFRRYFGSQRESASLKERLTDPYHHFNSCNFMATKSVFKKVVFNEKIKTYGHEDTDFSASVKEAEIVIQHIDNPLVHHPEDTFESYLEKTVSAVRNLVFLLKSEDRPSYSNIKLAKAYVFLKKCHLVYLVRNILTLFGGFFLRSLKKSDPNLLYFDLYKLLILLKLIKENGAIGGIVKDGPSGSLKSERQLISSEIYRR